MTRDTPTSENNCCSACETGSGPTTPLSSLRSGQVARVSGVDLEPADASLLRAMGLRPNSLLRVRRTGEPCIVEVLTGVKGDSSGCAAEGGCWCRIGLARAFAQHVLVTGAA